MNRKRFFISAFALVVALTLAAGCGNSAQPSQPAIPLPAQPAPISASPTGVQSAPASTPLPPAPAQPALAAAPVPTASAAPEGTPVSRARRPVSSTPVAALPPVLFPYTVTDGNGNEVTFDKPPERIVAFDSAAVETLFAIGEGQRLVGTHSFVSYPPEVDDVPRVGDAFNMNIEAILALEPDLVFIFFAASLADLERVGLKVLYLGSLNDDFSKVPDNIRMWGRITGNPAAAEAVGADFQARVQLIKDVMAPYSSGPSVFQDEGALWTPGPDTLMGQVFALLKLGNIAHDISGYAQLSPEAIVDRNPQIIIASYGDTISGTPAFKDLLAVRTNRIFVPLSEALSVAGPRFIDGIEELAEWVYPGLFDPGLGH